ncbi:MAG TPA: O-antigen ligase family protein [Candidatus Baltobacteraceae bacterium]
MLFRLHLTGPPVYPPLDTLGLIFYTAFFITVTLVTMRRAAYGACVLIAVVPFAFYQETLGENITLSKVAVLAVLLGLSAYPDAFAPVAAKAPWRILTAGVFVICAMLISFIHATYTEPVVHEALKVLEYLLVFCAAAAAYRLDPDRRAISRTFFATGIVVAILALAQEIVGAPSALLVNGHTVTRIAGPLEGPNQLAGYLDVALPIALAFAVRERSALARVALFFLIFAEMLTFSRGGLIGAAAAIITVAVVYRSQMLAAIAPLAGGIVAGLAVMTSFAVFTDSLGMLRWWNYESTYAGGVGTRPELWRAAITLWREHPLFGVGAGNFELDIPLTGLRGVRTHANSLYLQALVEGGIPLFAATLWLVYVSIATFVRERLESPFVMAALAAGVALALHQVVDYLTFYPKIGTEWWILMAIGAVELTAPVRTAQGACV